MERDPSIVSPSLPGVTFEQDEIRWTVSMDHAGLPLADAEAEDCKSLLRVREQPRPRPS